ncbi:DUF4124 domain-containing protein [Luteimonas deserti]|uniref:DUF4124 domain-containing protein n=1 Tax=Luteimonas deserti TaxID=2752306 RepID=A0A7Z0TUM4_9GAMM|nr:DUF4124 domain-containing protein [Luteimonas deserti]NYZ63006.1 DUF4124 domain-containing protein [Luteimonas deserti]
MGVVALALAAGGAQAQVYKCVRANGATEYAQTPCGENAREVEVRSPPTTSAEDGSSRNRQAIAQSTALSSAGIAERNCVQRAEADILGPSNRRAAAYQQQINALNAQLARADNDLAGATSQSGIRSQIAGIQQAMATDRSSANAQVVVARQECATARRTREDEIRRQTESAASL